MYFQKRRRKKHSTNTKNLDKLTKNELIKILKTILKDHPEYFYLIKETKITTENPEKVLKATEREVTNHTGSVLKAYQIYQGYKTNDSKSKSFIELPMILLAIYLKKLMPKVVNQQKS